MAAKPQGFQGGWARVHFSRYGPLSNGFYQTRNNIENTSRINYMSFKDFKGPNQQCLQPQGSSLTNFLNCKVSYIIFVLTSLVTSNLATVSITSYDTIGGYSSKHQKYMYLFSNGATKSPNHPRGRHLEEKRSLRSGNYQKQLVPGSQSTERFRSEQ